MKIYIAGPMTGYANYNVDAFIDAQLQWQADGHIVQTPFDANSRVWRKHFGCDFDPYKDTCEYGDPILCEMFAEDIAVLAWADTVVLLPGWEKSKGVAAELGVARLLGKRILMHETQKAETILQEAQRLVHGDRGEAYGHPLDDYILTGHLMGGILHEWSKVSAGSQTPIAVPPELATLCMVMVKASRESRKHKRDNCTDMAGYAECTEMIHAEKKRRGLP